jgi:hypothetical protein
MRRLINTTLGLAIILGSTSVQPVTAQERLRDFRDGDGRIHGAPTLPVVEQDLHPGQVQTINLSTNMHTVLEFPFPVARLHAGDPSMLIASIEGNKVILKSTRVTRGETNASIILGDADFTVVPFLIRTDESQPVVFLVRYTDPLSKHLNRVEQDISARLSAAMEQRVNDLAEARLRQRLLFSGRPIEINRQMTARRGAEKVTVDLQNMLEVPSAEGQSKAYLRYSVRNGTVAPLADMHFVLRIVERRRSWIFFEREVTREIYDVEDVRSADPVPAGMAATGLLIVDSPELRPGTSISIEFVAFNGQLRGKFDRVISGNH